ncbi:MAG: NAD-dependent epimerase/dehydratase family protein [Ktedonobacterales bacterium]
MTSTGRTQRRRVLLTGAAGGIGQAFFRFARDDYQFRLADRVEIAGETAHAGDAGEHEVVRLDISDLAACQHACERIDTVVHLAADANPEAQFYESLLDNNIKGTYNIFRAAKDQGCRRVIFASSAWVVGGYPQGVQLAPDTPLRPVNLYGVSKCFGEAVAAYFAQAEGLSSVVVRIGAYDNGSADNWLRSHPVTRESAPYVNARELAAYVSARDLHQLLVRCIEAPDIGFAIAHGLSENRFKRLDLTSTRELLGYAPQDDAFAVFSETLGEWLRD